MTHNSQEPQDSVPDDSQTLTAMGYSQELRRHMGPFQNFAISFSIVCVLAGGITAFPVALCAAGGASIGFGWPVASAFALLVAAAMAQIASAYPTAGGIYHWASILGGRAFGWVAAWFNLLGLLFVVASVNFGVFLLSRDLLLGTLLGVDVASWTSETAFDHGWWAQTLFVSVITISQAVLNHVGIRVTTLLTDLSGYLIFVVVAGLSFALLLYAPSLDVGRPFTFANYSGEAGGGVWPDESSSMVVVFLLGLLQGVYTLTGYDASAHTAEETHQAAREAPRGMLRAVFWSFVVGYVMLAAFVLAMPSVDEGAKRGWGVFGWLLQSSGMPGWFKTLLVVGIVLANYVCALASLTSTSRMMFAFARDGGLPFSAQLKKVSPRFRTPAQAIWCAALMAIVATLYGNAFVVLSAGCAVLLYISYLMPVVAGLRAEWMGTWSRRGPFVLGKASVPVATLATLGCALLIWVGVQPPNEKVGYLVVAMLLALGVVWLGGVGKRFVGPPRNMISK